MENKVEFADKCIIVKTPIGGKEMNNIFEATRRCWRINLNRARKADYVLGTIDGEVLCVIKVKGCDYVSSEFCEKEKKVCKEKFRTNIKLCEAKKRIAFEGKEIKDDKKYLGKKLPEEYIPGRMPVRYTY